MTDIVERLRGWAGFGRLDEGDTAEIVRLMTEAADEIERLRSLAGKADVGPSFSDVTSELRHQTPDA